METLLNPTWDLEVIFPGGSKSPQFAAYLEELDQDLDSIKPAAAKLTAETSHAQWETLLNEIQSLLARFRQAAAFVHCLTAQDVTDSHAHLLTSRIRSLGASFSEVMTTFDDALKNFSDPAWDEFLAQPEFADLQFVLHEKRRRAGMRLSAPVETLVTDLAVDGYHAWGDLYNTLVGRLKITVEREGEKQTISLGQADNLLSHPDRDLRRQTFALYEQAWEDQAKLLAGCLNHLAGFRLNLYRHRKWEDVLQEPLDINRMAPQTLAVMWDTITLHKARVRDYLNRKAQILGLTKLAWYDVEAPLGAAQDRISYEAGADMIITQFGRFDPALADFAATAFSNRWIEAEDRPGKRQGGFCTSFPLQKQSRIFTTYSGTPSNVATLAHELGHAYHQRAMEGLPQFNQGYAMNVAETASTFGEMLVIDAAIKNAADPQQRLALLEDKIQRSVAFFMNIHARFLFETRFYASRKQGQVSAEQLNDLMTAAQKEAYIESLDQYHPYFWASKLHFYITSTPFYNFPYTFGYLFSQGIYARALAAGKGFAAKYRNLLRDTGRMSVEDLAAKHLGMDLTQPDFWQEAVGLSLKDIDEFLDLTKTTLL